MEVTCNMGVLTPVLECMFDVAMNKSLQELSSSVTEAVQCYMTQRTLDNALRPHTHTHTHTHTGMHTLHTITNQMSGLLIASVTRFSNIPFSRCECGTLAVRAHNRTHTRPKCMDARTPEQLRITHSTVCLPPFTAGPI